jgi:glycosyltransferase involved in cell wall biosynthesis
MNLKVKSEDKAIAITPVISIIIPFYGEIEDLQNCLRGIEKQNFNDPFETIVLESGNSPEVKQLVNLFPNVVLISSSSVMYPGKARNLGVAEAKADLLAFIDADCVPLTDWLSEISLSLTKGSKIVIGPVTNLYPFHPIASVDNLLQFIDFQKGRPSKNINHFPACNLGISKELFRRTDGFPEDVITGEDVKFSQSAINQCNGQILFNRWAIVQHCGRKNFCSFLEHNRVLGFYRGYLGLKFSSVGNKFRGTFLFSFLFGLKRLVYITLRTLQWNPLSIFRIVFYFPFVIIGLAWWVYGFWKGNKRYLEIQN